MASVTLSGSATCLDSVASLLPGSAICLGSSTLAFSVCLTVFGSDLSGFSSVLLPFSTSATCLGPGTSAFSGSITCLGFSGFSTSVCSGTLAFSFSWTGFGSASFGSWAWSAFGFSAFSDPSVCNGFLAFKAILTTFGSIFWTCCTGALSFASIFSSFVLTSGDFSLFSGSSTSIFTTAADSSSLISAALFSSDFDKILFTDFSSDLTGCLSSLILRSAEPSLDLDPDFEPGGTWSFILMWLDWKEKW